MKKKLFCGMIALLGASLLFLACPTETSDDGGTGTVQWPDSGDITGGGGGSNLAAQAQAVANLIPGASASGTTITIADGATLPATDSVTIPAGITLAPVGNFTVAGDLTVEGDLVVPDNKVFTVEGDLKAAGKVTVPDNATFVVEGTGTYELADGVTGTNTGTVEIKSGAVVRNGAGVDIGGTGINVVEAGAKVYFNGQTYPFIGTPSDTDAEYQLGANAKFTYNDDGFIIEGGNVTVVMAADADGDAKLTISEATPLLIKNGAKLIIDATGVVRISNKNGVVSAVTGEGNTSLIQVIGTLYYMYSSYTLNKIYFFDNAGNNSVVSPADYSVPANTYIWDAGLASSAGGWKVQ